MNDRQNAPKINQSAELTAHTPREGERVVSFDEISAGAAEVVIEHEGQRYRLRATRNGRLLLNK